MSDLHSALDKRKTIFIADDSETIRTKIRQALERDTDFEVCGEAGKGGKGGRVKSRKQAIAIGLSEACKKGAKVPAKR